MSDVSKFSVEGARGGSLAAFCHPSDVAGVSDIVSQLGRPVLTVKAGGPEEAALWCGEVTPPSILLVNIDGVAHPVPALADLAAVAGPECRIVAMGGRQDVNLYRKLLQVGVFDYLVSPLDFGVVSEVVARAADNLWLGQPGAESVRVGQTLAVVGAMGGVGASTLVTALGLYMAEDCKLPTVLVDYDRRRCNLALLLGLEANSGLESILNASSVDFRLIQRTLLAQENNDASARKLHLLTQRPGGETPVDPEVVLQLGGALCQLFSQSVWDIPSHRPVGSDAILANADTRIIVTDYTLQHARATHMLLSEFGEEQQGQRLFIVANATRNRDMPVVPRTQFEDFLKRRVDFEVPCVGNSLDKSLLEGRLDFSGVLPFAQATARVACGVLGRPAPASGGADGKWRRLFRRG